MMDLMNMKGKQILITGASSGIGRTAAKYFDSLGAELILVARREEELKALSNQMLNPCRYISYDLDDLENIESVFSQIKEWDIKLDAMLYCAGICNTQLIKDVEYDELQKTFHVNTMAFYLMAKYFSMVKYSNKESAIVAISSISSKENEAGMSLYSMTKAAMNTAVEVMAKEFIKRKIRVNAVLPAQVMSKMGRDEDDWTEEELQEVASYQPYGAIPIEQVINCANFLLSDAAKYITGETVVISGGYKFRK